ncbi:hypothetical protein NUW54_g14221 [Trametes sanguinea]|uniref:Uncharacterized protein n=1 Tax=Trametes sanguinea TaxID=158606 RepID=A0ACC1MFW2_9APHY|nr:hypothetical protein NUW54_g14221 [Trametes sanguinea]
MTTLLAPIAEQNVGPIPGVDADVEPDAQWKEALRSRIERGLQSMVDKCLSGRGDKDVEQISQLLPGKWEEKLGWYISGTPGEKAE